MNRYKLTFTKQKSVFIVAYKNGQFARIDYKSGGLSESHFKYLTQAVPIMEKDIKGVMQKYDNRVMFEKLSESNKDSLFAKAMRVYCVFYEEQTELKPRINGIEGNALKGIINHLLDNCVTDDEVSVVWATLLHNWSKLPEFYKSQRLLRQINHNLPTLLTHLKQDAANKNKQNSDADAVRESL